MVVLEPTQTLAIEIKKLSATYPNSRARVLNAIDLQLPQGELIALIGPNGAGKSTLFKILMGLKKPLSGSLAILGQGIHAQRKNSMIAYMPQEGDIDWDFPIEVKDVVFTGRFGYLRTKVGQRLWPFGNQSRDHKIVDAALQAVDMQEQKDRPIGALSGGQKKRVFLARALAQEGKIFLLDEPLAGVDRYSEGLILDLLLDLRNQGKTILIATHDIAGMKRFADKAVLLNKEVVACGNPEEVVLDKWISQAFGKTLQFV